MIAAVTIFLLAIISAPKIGKSNSGSGYQIQCRISSGPRLAISICTLRNPVHMCISFSMVNLPSCVSL